MKAPIESSIPGWLAPANLLRPRVLPMNVTAPLVFVVNRLQYPDEVQAVPWARAAVATAIVTMNAAAAVRRGAVMADSRSPRLGLLLPDATHDAGGHGRTRDRRPEP